MDTDRLREFLQNIPYIKFNGIVVDKIGPESSSLYVDMRPELCNPYGMAHGGLLFTLIDTTGGATARADGRKYVTLNASVNYLRSAYSGRVRATSRMRKRGKTTCIVDVDVTDENGRLCATGTTTMFCLGDNGYDGSVEQEGMQASGTEQ